MPLLLRLFFLPSRSRSTELTLHSHFLAFEYQRTVVFFLATAGLLILLYDIVYNYMTVQQCVCLQLLRVNREASSLSYTFLRGQLLKKIDDIR